MTIADAEDDVLAANRSFYGAFEAHDLDAMSDLWEHTDGATCVHPGWPLLRGWSSVAAGWMTLFQGPRLQQFLLADEYVTVVGDAAWVTIDENILYPDGAATVCALNLFVRTDVGWRMIAHHGSSVAPQG